MLSFVLFNFFLFFLYCTRIALLLFNRIIIIPTILYLTFVFF